MLGAGLCRATSSLIYVTKMKPRGSRDKERERKLLRTARSVFPSIKYAWPCPDERCTALMGPTQDNSLAVTPYLGNIVLDSTNADRILSFLFLSPVIRALLSHRRLSLLSLNLLKFVLVLRL